MCFLGGNGLETNWPCGQICVDQCRIFLAHCPTPRAKYNDTAARAVLGGLPPLCLASILGRPGCWGLQPVLILPGPWHPAASIFHSSSSDVLQLFSSDALLNVVLLFLKNVSFGLLLRLLDHCQWCQTLSVLPPLFRPSYFQCVLFFQNVGF